MRQTLKQVLVLTAGLTVAGVLGARAQVVHSVGATVQQVNWQATTSPDSVRLDLDGDQVADIVLRTRDEVGTGAAPSRRFFWLVPLQADVEPAADSAEYDSAHRFQAGGLIRWGLRWAAPGSTYRALYLAYFLTGNGGVGGRGFFRDGLPGYAVVRKPAVGGGWRYWWVRLQATPGSYARQVYFYGLTTAPGPLAAVAPTPPLPAIYPNPATDRWYLPGRGAYRLRDAAGRVVGQGESSLAAPFADARGLVSGVYWLEWAGRTLRVSKQ